MKRKLSIPALWVSMTFWGALCIIILMAASELVGFAVAIPKLIPEDRTYYMVLYSDAVENLGVKYFYRAALALLFFWIFFSCRARAATVSRLSVSEGSITMWHAAVIAGWFLALFAAQLGVIYVSYGWFHKTVDPSAVSGQSLMIAFYESPTLHWLIPLADWPLLLADAAIYMSLILSMAVDSHLLRHGGRVPMVSGILAAVLEVFFGSKNEKYLWLIIAGALILAAIQVIRLVKSCKEEAIS